MRMTIPTVLAAVCLLSVIMPGCAKDEERRATSGFSVDAARGSIAALQQAILSKNPKSIEDCVPPALSNLQAVAIRLGKESPTRKDERLAAAQKALTLFTEVAPDVKKLSPDEAKAKFAPILALLDQVEAK